MDGMEQIIRLSRERCFSVWYDVEEDRYYPDNSKTESGIWICDVEREITADQLRCMTKLVLEVTKELQQKGYLK